MKRTIVSICIALFISISISAQNKKVNVTFFGSSVCKGAGAEDNHGYAHQLFHNNNSINTEKFKYFNASTGGDNTLRVERFDRLTKKLYPTNPNIVVIGLSLGNEGIGYPTNEIGRERIVEQFRSRLLTMADSLHNQGMQPVIVNCYANTFFNDAQYNSTKKMNRIINTWDYPSINVLGTIDDGTGKWVDGFVNDPWHPSYEGHTEMSYAFVPSLFEAITQGKKTPKLDWNPSFYTLKNEKAVTEALSFNVEHTMHSFSISFKFKGVKDGSIAGFTANGERSEISTDFYYAKYKGLKEIYPKHQAKNWNHVVLSHNYANQRTQFFLNGKLVGEVKEQLSPSEIHFGGTAETMDIKDVCIYRSSLNEDEAQDLFENKFIQSSLEFYNPMTKPISGKALENQAQSLSILKINTKVEFVHKNLKL